jgi:hypothetical protein
MLLTDEEIASRIESPMNLLNRLRTATKAVSPSLPSPKAKDIISDLDDKLVGNARQQAAGILDLTLKELRQRIPDIQKPEKLAQIADQMNKILTSRPEKENEKNGPSIIVYAPSVVSESHFETVILKEDQVNG